MSMDKFCPMLSTDTNLVWCNEDCAWLWNKKRNSCAIAALAKAVGDYDEPAIMVNAEVKG